MFETSINAEARIKGMPAAATRTRILVVDDAKFDRELLKLHLGNAGYEVLMAEDAVVAGKLVLLEAPDLIITDVNMPYMSGIEFITALRADRTIPDIPVVFLTSQEEIVQETKRLRAAAYLKKPVQLDRLLQIVAFHVPAQSLNRP
jgi:two-component system chemotaxis response regulator CheY